MNMPVTDSVQRFIDAHKYISPPGNPRLAELRDSALARFTAAGFPSTREEQWKYTNLRSLERREFALPADTPATLPDAASLPFAEAGFPTLTYVNGRYAGSLSRVEELPETVQASSLAALLDTQPSAFMSRLEDNDGAFTALNTAFFADGAVIDVAAGARPDQPIHLLFVSQRAEDSVVCHPRVFINAGRGSEITIIEHHIGVDDAVNFTNSVVDITLEDGAAVNHCRIQEESIKSFHISNTRVHQARNSRYTLHNIDLGGALVRNDLHARLEGTGAEAELTGLFVLGGRQHCDNHTLVDHVAPHTRSRERYKGILDGRARGVFNGKVYVAAGAQRIDAAQASHNLLLSENAEIDTKPELEIYADDVKCSHGATVGQLDETALFYLRSRGLDADQARSVLTTAFAREQLNAIAAAPVRTYLERAVQARMETGGRQ